MNTPTPEHPIDEFFLPRQSVYVFDPKPVEPDKLQRCLTAAAWAASSFNEQPWSFILARREDEAAFEKMLGCLVEANQAWARNAGALMLTAVARNFTKNGKPNRVAEHDLGAAAAHMALQAAALGLQMHQMAGVELGKIRTEYAIPAGYDPLTGIAIGYPGDLDSADENLAQRKHFYICSLSTKVIVYKGMLTPEQVPAYYADLRDPRTKSAIVPNSGAIER